MSDGELRTLFKTHLPTAHWQPIETWSTGQGVPDAEFCFPGGRTGWIENKKTASLAVNMEPEQIAWLEQRSRMGGACFVAVRRQTQRGPRRGAACDELWLLRGSDARSLYQGGLEAPGIAPLGRWAGGPARWDWAEVKSRLLGRKDP